MICIYYKNILRIIKISRFRNLDNNNSITINSIIYFKLIYIYLMEFYYTHKIKTFIKRRKHIFFIIYNSFRGYYYCIYKYSF